ncbi:Hsp20/alpha crystallin family protein [Croceiramulus getboli]|nr:Hsp20/alpha crystallin family protein [Flavobacteriaceae bacterium YJPT1-3]
MNVKETENDFQVELAIPGFSKEEIEVTMENDLLFIQGNRSQEEVEEEEDYTRKEFSYNHFERKLQLPATVDQEKEVKAKYKNGVLRLNLAKYPESAGQSKKKIAIA